MMAPSAEEFLSHDPNENPPNDTLVDYVTCLGIVLKTLLLLLIYLAILVWGDDDDIIDDEDFQYGRFLFKVFLE
jgi:hypothetical protein